MRITFPAPDIGDEEGFTNEKDLFGRAEIGRGVTNLVGKVSEPLVIAVDGQWGSGKTTFLKMWAGELRKQGYPVVYFDAFANDYFDDAFAAIADAIIALVESKKKTTTRVAKNLIAGTARVAKVLGRGAIKLGVKLGTLGALDASDFDEAIGASAEDVAQEASDSADKLVETYLEHHREQRDVVAQFHTALSQLPEALAPNEPRGEQASPPKPVIFIIDELDRCRPHFALQVLERIKHFFTVPNMHFVLGAHIEQLRNSVSATYGSGVNAQVYLEKFIHLTVHLVDSKRQVHERNLARFVGKWLMSSGLEKEDAILADHAIVLIRHVAEVRDLSFRTVEKILANLTLAIHFTPSPRFRQAMLLAGLCVLKVTHPTLFVKAKTGSLTYADVVDPLALEHAAAGGASTLQTAGAWWKHCLGKVTPNTAWCQNELIRYNIDEPKDAVSILANRMVDWWGG